MAIKKIDAAMLKKCFLAGACSIEAKKEYINELNVFPVPDGDTGTNMSLTIMSAAKEVNSLENPTMEELAKAISSGSLRGARGNSGVILSQLFRGFTKEIKECNEIDVTVLANSFQRAVETAYKAVMKPKEGTILTVSRGGATKAAELVGETEDIVEFGEKVLKHMKDVLNHTPDLLPVLKEAGVVDSGGMGLVTVLQGAYDCLLGKEPDVTVEIGKTAKPTASATGRSIDRENISTADIKFGYCTEFIILLDGREFSDLDETEFKAYLESIGDSIVCVADDEVVKVHVHTNDPGLAIQKALTFGQLTRLKIDNMREEHNEVLELDAARSAEAAAAEKKQEPRKKFGFIAVSIGDGVNEIFKGLGVDNIIEGGQTMNPSAGDMLEAIDAINADTIYILPNNKNIILAADQAKAMTKDKEIVVVPSKTVPQGITALISFLADKSPDENLEVMKEAMQSVKSGQVTYAVRDTSIDGKEIKQGDYMGLDDKTIASVGSDLQTVTFDLISSMTDDDSELISIYYGQDVTEDDANAVASLVTELYPLVDVEVHPGGQPVYYYVISVE